MKVNEIIQILEGIAPGGYQEQYDNSGLNIGKVDMEVNGILCTIDVTEEVVDEAISKGANLIVAHHPLLFTGLKSITGKNFIERSVIKAIQNEIAIYVVHTNIDNVHKGVNSKVCQKLGLTDCKILSPIKEQLYKLVTFVPKDFADKIRKAIFDAGAGHIGEYDCCSFNVEGKGSFRGLENSNQFTGKKGEIHFEDEIRIEVILPRFLKSKVINNMINAHPYEEVAYDLYPLANDNIYAGAGMIGSYPEKVQLKRLLKEIQLVFNAEGIRYTGDLNKQVQKIAVCGGSGSFLINTAKAKGAEVFITGDVKYHQFFDAENSLNIVDIGHYESEQFTKEIFYESVIKKMPKFAVHLSKVKTNPVKYFK